MSDYKRAELIKDAVCDWCIECGYDGEGHNCMHCSISSRIDSMPSADVVPIKDKDFYEFLWNVINPNEMETYLAMFNAKGVPTDE